MLRDIPESHLATTGPKSQVTPGTTFGVPKFGERESGWLDGANRGLLRCFFFEGQALYGCFLKWWYPPFHTPKWSFLVGTPMVVGHPYIHYVGFKTLEILPLKNSPTPGLQQQVFFQLKNGEFPKPESYFLQKRSHSKIVNSLENEHGNGKSPDFGIGDTSSFQIVVFPGSHSFVFGGVNTTEVVCIGSKFDPMHLWEMLKVVFSTHLWNTPKKTFTNRL